MISPSVFARRAWWLAGGICLAGLLGPLLVPPAHDFTPRTFRTPPLSRGMRLDQTFQLPVDGFHAVEFSPVPTGRPVSGTVWFELVDITKSPERIVYATGINAGNLAAGQPYRVEFPPIANSKRRLYRIGLSAPDTPSGEGVALWATRGDGYEPGTMWANGRRRWADLVFRTSAPSSSALSILLEASASGRARGRLVLVLFGATWLALGAVLLALARVWETAPPAARPVHDVERAAS